MVLTQKKNILLAMGIIVGLTIIFGPEVPPARFGYDESDYMQAVSQGFRANYLDRNAIPLSVYLSRGSTSGLKTEDREDLSTFIRSSDDITFYRHYHAPLYFYWLALVGSVLGFGEVVMRSASFATILLGAGVVYFICWTLARQNRTIAAITGVTVLLLGLVNTQTALKITPHGLYAVVVAVSLFSFARLLEGGSIKYWYLSLISLAVSVLTLEFAPLLILAFLILVWWKREQVFADPEMSGRKKKIIKPLAWTGAILFLSWPAGLLKLTLLKNYIFFTYFSLIRGSAYGEAALLEIWWQRIQSSPWEFTVVVLGLALTAFRVYKRESNPLLIPFLLYAGFIFLATLRIRSLHPAYFSSLTMVTYIICSISFAEFLAERPGMFKFAVTGLLLLTLGLNNLTFVRPTVASAISDPALNAAVDHFLQNPPIGNLMVPKNLLPPLNYYLPDSEVISYSRSAGPRQVLKALTGREVNNLILMEPEGENLALEFAQAVDVKSRQQIYKDQDGTAMLHLLLGPEPAESNRPEGATSVPDQEIN